MKKKMISVLMIVWMIIGTLAGCGGDSPQETNSQAASGQDQKESTDNPLRPETLDTIKVVLFGEESPRMQELMEKK